MELEEGKPRFRASRNLAGQPGTLFLHEDRLPLRNAARELFDLLLLLAASSRALRFRSRLLAGGAFQFLAFFLAFDLGGVCHV